MKPLVNYCRWKEAKLRLRARDDRYVRGQLVFRGNDGEEITQDFQFELAKARLILIKESGDEVIFLDEMGIAIPDDEQPG